MGTTDQLPDWERYRLLEEMCLDQVNGEAAEVWSIRVQRARMRNILARLANGIIFMIHDDLEKARGEMFSALIFAVTNPEKALVHSVFGAFYLENSQVERAIEEFTNAIQCHPDDGFFYKLRAIARESAGDMEGKLHDLECAASLGI